MLETDVVIVSYNSRDRLRACVEPLLAIDGVTVIVVDNDSPDKSLEAVDDLPVLALGLDANYGFAHGCNVGWRAGSSPFVLFLNPDATIDQSSLNELARVLEQDARVGAAAPKIKETDGSLALSQRRFPRLRSTYANALFLHRLFPRAEWASELVRDSEMYQRPGSPEWVSGACMLVRRSLLEQLEGFDQGFFLYCEDKDLCRRIRDAGYDVRYEPSALAIHEGGASAPRAALLPVLAASRVRYAGKHRSRLGALLERVGVGLSALTHIFVTKGGLAARAGHAEALLTSARRLRPRTPRTLDTRGPA